MRDEHVAAQAGGSGNTVPSRRGFLTTLLTFAGAGLAGMSGDVVVGRKKRKKCKKKCPPVKQPLTCADVCDPGCDFCFQRTAGSPVCGNNAGFAVPCVPCETDGQCVGTIFPYCLSAGVEQSSGMTTEISCLGSPGSCGIPTPCSS